MKILKSSYISPFGGINFIVKELDRLDIGGLLKKNLPELPKQSKFDWRELLFSYWSVFFCGGDCAEDLSGNLKSTLGNIPHLKCPSPDRVLNRLKELTEGDCFYTTPRGRKIHHFSFNSKLVDLNLKILKKLDVFNEQNLTLDYDNTICFSKKKDATSTYLHKTGYNPGVGLIGSNIVYLENRNGNSPAQVLQDETLQRIFDHLEKNQIKIDKFRADSASYGFPVLLLLEQKVNKFYIRARMSSALSAAIEMIEEWKEVKSSNEILYRGEIIFTPFLRASRDFKNKGPLKPKRLIVTKTKRKDGQINMFTNEDSLYACIVTNDMELTPDQIVHFYNQRGKAEKEFDILKNDFGWRKLPFSELGQNLVYLIVMAICRNLYNHIIKSFSPRIKGLKPTDRIKKFIFRFICVPAKWVKTARTWKLRIYGEIAFKT